MNSSRPKPRATYLTQSQTPEEFVDNPPPKLLIMGTGGILVHRQRPLPGRYESLENKDMVPSDSNIKIEAAGPFASRPYGKQFRTKSRMESKEKFFAGEGEEDEKIIPLPEIETAPFHLVIWTAAQIQNSNANIASIFGQSHETSTASTTATDCPLQPLSSQLLRVYDRKTLQPEGTSSYKNKTPSWKDLEITRKPLNTGDESLLDAGKRFTKQKQSRGQLEECSQTPWGPHNTLQIIDDAADIHAQPYNVLLVPEFAGTASNLANSYRKSADSAPLWNSDEDEESDSGNPIGLSVQDDGLLQLLGVLEAARFQKNFSSWIRGGSLGRFGETAKVQSNEELGVGKGKSCEEWAEEGREVLKRKGITIKF